MLTTNNEAWGFYGTIRSHANPDEAWALAMQAIGFETGCPENAVRDFLDSRFGRHFADGVANQLSYGITLRGAIKYAVGQWMSWKTNRATKHEYGIPAGLPYLTGFVAHCEIEAEHDA